MIKQLTNASQALHFAMMLVKRRKYDDEFQTPAFLTANNLKPFISNELMENSIPVIFEHNGTKVIGYKAELLPQVCEVFLDAKEAGKLTSNQNHIAQACKMLHRGFARIGIIGLIDEATGFEKIKERVMEFELDQDYFNRAGDQVRYVGFYSQQEYYLFRDREGHMWQINADGSGAKGVIKCPYDIIGLWEITDDPDRIYVIDGKEWHYGDTITRYNKRSLILKPGGSDIEYVEKILIKPATCRHKKAGDTEWREGFNKIEPRTWPPVGGYPYDDLEELNKKIEYIPGKPFNIEAKKLTGREIYDLIEPIHSKLGEIIDSINRINNAG